MKKLILSIALITILASVLILTGCNRVLISEKNGPTTTQNYDFTDFTGIEIGHAFKLEVTYADTYKVTITAAKSVLDRIEVKKVGSTLVIDMDAWFFSWNRPPN